MVCSEQAVHLAHRRFMNLCVQTFDQRQFADRIRPEANIWRWELTEPTGRGNNFAEELRCWFVDLIRRIMP